MTRRNWINKFVIAACLVCVALTPAAAQDLQPREEHRREMEERIRERFASMLRGELALSDEQAETVLPAMADLEQFKREIGRERRETVRTLRTGMQEGASDAQLQASLDRLDQIEDDLRSAERNAMATIDAELNTRQRVKLRFFVGLTHAESAELLDLSRSAADRAWVFARAWLFQRMQPEQT